MRLARVVLPVLLLTIAGCGQRPAEPGTPGEEDPLRGRTFLSTEVTEAGKPRPLVARTRVSLNFTDDGRLLATAGCNTMSGPVDTADGRIDVNGGLSTTGMGCEQPLHEQDSWLAELLGAGPAWRLDGTRLVLRTQDVELVLADREVADPDRPLTGTTWTVDTILDGQTASSTPAGATATLRFAEDVVEISGGCNGGSAAYTRSGDTIRFDDAVMTLRACTPDIMRLETAVLDVIRDEVEVRIDADRLTLTRPSGEGIQLHAT